jgi:serine/threonine protein kinase
MGEVYRARDLPLGRTVAIKILPAALATNPDSVWRFEVEARAAGALNHPNILAIYALGRIPTDLPALADRQGSSFIVTELLEGESLRDRLANGPVPLRKATEWAKQIANGLAAAHTYGVVHRDLKPENLFVTHAGHVKILDFGLAKLTTSDMGETRAHMTAPGVILGTPGYMAPEQLKGESADHRADIFSFGAILFELLVGQRLFATRSPADALRAMLASEPLELNAGFEKLGPVAERIVRRCLAPRPKDRFQSAGDLAFALEML